MDLNGAESKLWLKEKISAGCIYLEKFDSMMKQNLYGTIAIFLFTICASTPVFATVYDVNSLGNTNSGSGTSGTLLYCVSQANLSAGPHAINFSVAGTISINSTASLLPALNQSITIDGSTAPGYAGSPVIILDGTGLGSGHGIEITAADCGIYGLEIANFPYSGLYLNGPLVNNFIIGTSSKGNVIRSNGYFGISLDGAHDGVIAYNHIGTDVTGSTCLGNGYDGIDFINSASNNQILYNHISCNGYDGIQVGGSNNNVIKGNIIGPLANACQGNLYDGINIKDDSQDNTVGGTSPADFNKLAGNQYWGIKIENNASENLLSGNSYLCNSYGAINLDNGNNNMPAPVISSANATSVSGTSSPNAVIEVFKSQSTNSAQCPGAPGAQGADFLGTTTADAGGNWTLTGVFGGYLTATARDANNNTSAFGSNVFTGIVDTLVNACSGSILSVVSAFSPSATGICEKACIDFTDQSQNAAAWHWYFQGATPDTSTLQNPVNICYNDSGIFPVTLVVYDASGTDSSVSVLYITVHPTPPIPVITISGDTLTSTSAITYQWYLNSVSIPGATDLQYIAQQSGFYYVEITDSAGCTSISLTSYIDLTGLPGLNDSYMELSFNAQSGNCELIIYGMEGKKANLIFYDLYGRTLKEKELNINSPTFTATFQLTDLPTGLYLVRLSTKNADESKKVMLHNWK